MFQGSWKTKLLQCVRNRDKYHRKKFDGSVSTKGKGSMKSSKKRAHIYIPIISSSDNSIKEQRQAMLSELTNAIIRDDVLKPLMSATFNERQLIIGETAIAEVLAQYPALRRPVIVSWYYYMCTFFITIYTCIA